jgi:hypothetical protein
MKDNVVAWNQCRRTGLAIASLQVEFVLGLRTDRPDAIFAEHGPSAWR